MAFEQRDGSGALFRNDKKEAGSQQPDYRGDCNVGGQIMEIAAWIKPKNGGGSFMSLAFKPKVPYEPEEDGPRVTNSIDDDDIPF